MTQTQDALPESGRLNDTPLPRLLLKLHQRRFDGRLTLSCDRGSKTFQLHGGAPASAESNLKSESLGAQLVERRLIDRTQLMLLERKMAERGCSEPVALLSLELIEPKLLYREIKDRVRRSVVGAFAWQFGEFTLDHDGSDAEAIESFRCDPIALVHQGLCQYWSADQILGDLATRMKQFPSARKELARTAARLESAGGGGGLLLAFDGTKSLGQLIGPSLHSIATMASLWVADALALISYSDTPSQVQSDEGHDFEAQIEIAVAAGEAHRASAAPSEPKPEDAPAVGAGGDAAARSDAADALRSEIETLGANLASRDYYELLGLAPGAKATSIKKAYFKAAKQYHPDTLARLQLGDLKEDAARIFARIAQAFEVLSDVRKRKDYDASLRGELTEAEAAQVAQAEMSYRKAEILLRMGDFKAALEFLRPAVEIFPQEGEYQSALGWALYKQPKSDPDAAVEHLAKAVELSPRDAVSHFRYGMVLRAAGDENTARKHLEIARQLDPKSG